MPAGGRTRSDHADKGEGEPWAKVRPFPSLSPASCAVINQSTLRSKVISVLKREQNYELPLLRARRQISNTYGGEQQVRVGSVHKVPPRKIKRSIFPSK